MPQILAQAASDTARSARTGRTGRAERARIAPREGLGEHRLEALAEIMPWLAGLAGGCALLLGWALRGDVGPGLLGGWVALVLATGWVTIRARRRALAVGGAITRSAHWAALETLMLAIVWAALPAALFAGQPPATDLLLGGALGTMIAGALLLALVPLAATIWALTMASALIWGATHAGVSGTIGSLGSLAPLLGAYVLIVIVASLSVERMLCRHLRAAAIERNRSDAMALLLQEYEESGAGWLWQIDANHRLTYVSPPICDLLGRSTAQLLGQSLPVIFGGDGILGVALGARQSFVGIELPVAAAGGARWIALSGRPIAEADGTPAGFRGVGADVTDARLSQERLTHMASIDVLTGLPNRQRMRELVGQAIVAAEQSGRPCAVLFLDLDGFKPVNDTFGHPLGDAVLRAVAQRLAQEVGTLGQVGRLGGDEFALVLENGYSRQAVEDIGLKLIRAIAEPYLFESAEIRIGLSIGCAFAPIDGNSIDELLVKADLALYQAKSKGRGTFCHFDSKMQRDAEDRVKLEHDLRHAMKREQLEVHYQPIVSARTQQVVGFEALLRWQHPERGMVPPLTFVPIAEENGLIAEIGEWVIRTACRDAAGWPDDIFVSVNLSPRQLILPALPNAISEALSQTRLQPARLELEVTESVFMSDSDGSLDVLRRVRALGVGIALDDFGTGYSSLGYLNKTIFHTLKIDGSFVRDAAKKSETVSIIRAIVALANSFRMTITAEGVETSDDFERMRDLGCDKIQGYLFGRPMTYDKTREIVGERWELDRRRAS